MEVHETPPLVTNQVSSSPKNETPLANSERQQSFSDLVREKRKDAPEVQAEAANMLLGFLTRQTDQSENSTSRPEKQTDVKKANSLADAVREHGTTSDEAKKALLELLKR